MPTAGGSTPFSASDTSSATRRIVCGVPPRGPMEPWQRFELPHRPCVVNERVDTRCDAEGTSRWHSTAEVVFLLRLNHNEPMYPAHAVESEHARPVFAPLRLKMDPVQRGLSVATTQFFANCTPGRPATPRNMSQSGFAPPAAVVLERAPPRPSSAVSRAAAGVQTRIPSRPLTGREGCPRTLAVCLQEKPIPWLGDGRDRGQPGTRCRRQPVTRSRKTCLIVARL